MYACIHYARSFCIVRFVCTRRRYAKRNVSHFGLRHSKFAQVYSAGCIFACVRRLAGFAVRFIAAQRLFFLSRDAVRRIYGMLLYLSVDGFFQYVDGASRS